MSDTVKNKVAILPKAKNKNKNDCKPTLSDLHPRDTFTLIFRTKVLHSYKTTFQINRFSNKGQNKWQYSSAINFIKKSRKLEYTTIYFLTGRKSSEPLNRLGGNHDFQHFGSLFTRLKIEITEGCKPTHIH